MNYKFGIKIAALLATFTGTSIGPTTLLPSDWLSSAYAQPPIVSPNQAQARATSNMLAPIVPPVVKKSDVMPWEVEPSRYRSAIDPSKQNRPALVSQAQLNPNTAWVPAAPAKAYAPQVQRAVANVQQTGAGVRQAVATAADTARSQVQPAAATLAAPAKAQIPAGYSAAGVPLYSGPNAFAQAAPAFAPGQAIANAAQSPIARAASAAAAFAPPVPTLSLIHI